jgi:MFS family permease
MSEIIGKKSGQVKVGLYAAVVVFFAYTMIFGFRKSFTVATFDGIEIAGYSYKTILVISQVLGYLLAKFYGIKYISELRRTGRGVVILTLTGIAWLSWLLFAVVPVPYNIIFLFINGFPLGMLWGVVFSYVEGRRSTDFIGATLAVSFIFASGFVKSVGAWLMVEFGVTEFWVPFYTGLVFAAPLLLFVYLMEKIPPPSEEDVRLRTERTAMTREDRKGFVREFFAGIVACVLIYCFATIFRDIRDNFGAEMWKELGYFNQPAIFSKTETPITLIILVLIGSMVLIKNNYRALQTAHVFILIGFIIAGVSTLLFTANAMAPIWWMMLVGLGLYMVYIPFNAVFFDRLISTFRYTGNVGFLIYLADSFGYVGSVGVLLSKEIFRVQLNWVTFFSNSVIGLSAVGILLTAFSMVYFGRKYERLRTKELKAAKALHV